MSKESEGYDLESAPKLHRYLYSLSWGGVTPLSAALLPSMLLVKAASGSEPHARVTDGNLSGHHLRITSVNEPRYFNMVDSFSLLPASQWSGLFPEMIEWMAAQAGFTYVLLAASGNGSSCNPAGGAGADGVYASQYGCAQDDVTELGLTDIYAGAFYVTQSRLREGHMTTPYDCESGLAVFQQGVRSTIPEYIEFQKRGEKGVACTALGSAYSDWLILNMPTLRQLPSLQTEWVRSIRTGKCTAFIVSKPIGDIISSSVCDLELASGEASRAKSQPDPSPRSITSTRHPGILTSHPHSRWRTATMISRLGCGMTYLTSRRRFLTGSPTCAHAALSTRRVDGTTYLRQLRTGYYGLLTTGYSLRLLFTHAT